MKLRNLGKKMDAYLLIFAMIMSMFPQMSLEVHGNELPADTELNRGNEIQPYAENNAGDFNVTGGMAGNEWAYDSVGNTLTFNTSGDYTITGNGAVTTERIIIASNFKGNITVENVKIEISADDTCAFEVKDNAVLILTLEDTNYFKSGDGREGLRIIDSSVTINGTGTLEARVSSWADGIGIFDGTLVIDSGTINAYGGDGRAGIGGDNATIIINDGNITANGHIGGAGIGQGDNSSSKMDIIICGGMINATASTHGSTPDKIGQSIGYGFNGSGNVTITIEGGQIEAPQGISPAPKLPDPQFTTSTTADSITVNLKNYQNIFGKVQYKLDNGEWQDSSAFTGLQADTFYTISVKYADSAEISEASMNVKTLKDGNEVIKEPQGLAAIYGQKLSDVTLPIGWLWEDSNASLETVGTQSYLAVFDTTAYETEYDFSMVAGYNTDTKSVKRNLSVTVSKADSHIAITTDSMDKTYDKDSVSEPAYTTTGSTGTVTITWKKNTGTAEAPNWEIIQNAPCDAGSYQVVVTLADDGNYKSAEDTLEFVITQATNEWTDHLSMNGWTYNEKANTPTATAKFGDVVFTYSMEENGIYTDEIPANAGTYYVKATVVGNDNYTGLEEKVTFDIKKAIPVPETITGLVLGQGQALEMLRLPNGFAWEDEKTVADEYGNQQFKAIYTPADSANYEIIEVMLDVEVLPKMIPLNHVPTITAKDITLTAGDKFNDTIALKGVTATDKEDGDITKDIKVIKNTVDTSKAGTYKVSYQVTDSQGASVTKTIKAAVKAKLVTPDKENSTGITDSAVKTGDQTNLGVYASLLTISGLLLAILGLLKKKKALENR